MYQQFSLELTEKIEFKRKNMNLIVTRKDINSSSYNKSIVNKCGEGRKSRKMLII